ncbi:LTA synthase family protein [methanotrophic endosymbiont of Bathymodiolus puteoserpentis (Logatchev)]|uniref:LTA synthase family protein n=1 Tax=methanotrophic endosymbiont of Bathymodiolus puteoserpentis (Logatchev) TaxID=343235 RepID=UPI0013CD6F52|nr:sulfatase-like hydrolase/transferase [methanotrophic endosymbiont of Bathymodiolus puteoserpentis (Logatchev)]SHE23222.1 Predicted hydrolase [methanotrophic endosymbiont of Bathymodiolus puteoserpentis (Logatchev)]
MNLIRLEELMWRYRRVVSVFIVVIVVQLFELILLYYKYNIFTGGFLQPFWYQTFFERAEFIFVSLWFDTVFFGFFAILWFFIVDRLNKHGIYIYYIFTVFSILIMGGWLGFKFKVLSYFNDTVNFLILQNLGGGSVKDAFLYASNEITLFVAIIFVVIVLFIASFKFLKKFNYVRSFPINTTQQAELRWFLIFCVVLTPVMTLFILSKDSLRFGLQKKTSFYVVSYVLDKLSDVDFDGFGSFTFPRDKEVFNENVYPGALDIPGNGIDEDGFLGDAILPHKVIDTFAAITPNKGKHIVLIILESARVDLLEKKVNGQYVAPVLRKLAMSGTAVKQAYSHTGYTTTSLKAIFNRNLIGKNDSNLLTFLQKSGYQQSILSGQDESFGNVAISTGMKKEDVYYFDARTAIEDRTYVSKSSGSLRLSEERVVKQFKLRANELDFSQPQFIYLNFQAAHFPYSHPKMTKRIMQKFIPRSEINIANKEWVEETYWNAIANADWAVGEVINELEKHHALKNTTIVILGDHGESLFDDGFLGHGHAVNDAQTQIPLIINDTNIDVHETIGQVDVAEIAVRSALGLENQWVNQDKTVFQLVGSLGHPELIAHVRNGGERIIFDFRSEEVFFSAAKVWKTYKEAMADEQYKDRIENLIRDWEGLRWQAYLVRKHGG